MNIQTLSRGISWLLFGLLSLGAVSAAHGNEVPETVNLSLKTAMAMAIRNNLDLRVDALDSSMAAADVQRNRGIYDPALNLSANHGQNFYASETYGTKGTTANLSLTQYLPSGGSLSASTQTGYTMPASDPSGADWTDWYTSAGITFVQPLLKNFGRETMELNIALAANAHEDSVERFRLSVIDTVYSVIKAYNRLYTLRQVLESREMALSSARQLLDKLKQQDGSAERQDVELANTEYAISQRLKDLVNAERRVKDQEAKLRYLVGVQGTTNLIPAYPPSGEEPLETTEQAISLALEKQSTLKQLRLDLKASELQERVAKRRLRPDLSVNGSVGFRGIEDHFSDSLKQIGDGKGQWWSAGLQLSVPLGNTVAKSDYKRSELRTRQLKNRLTAAEWKLRDYIEADMRSLMSARVQRQVADKSVKIAEQRLEKYRKSLARKASKVQDLLNAENDLIYARNSQTDALEDFANAAALLWKDAGVLLERKNILVNISQPEQLTAETERLAYPVNSTLPLTAQIPATTPRVAAGLALTQRAPQSPVARSADKPLPSPVNQAARVASAVEGSMYTLKIGAYASSELAETRKKVKIAGLEPLVSVGPKQPRLVIRLNAGDYQNQQTAQEELRKLRAANAAGFILKRGRAGYRLYAGSYFSQDSALKEKQRLAALGADLMLEEARVLLPTSLLTAGQFSSHEAALAGAAKLESLGIQAVVQKNS